MTDTVLAPIAYRTLNDLVTEQLRDAILSGRFPPGTALNQRDIADQLSVSRMPVREAFRALELEGLIRGLPRRKAVVVTLQPEDVAEIVDILATLEARAAERIAERLDGEAIDRLRALNAELRASPSDVIRRIELDLEFHGLICQQPATRTALLVQTHRNALRPYVMATDGLASRRAEAEAEHDAIVAAFVRGDSAGAAAAVDRHVRAEGHALVAWLKGRLSAED